MLARQADQPSWIDGHAGARVRALRRRRRRLLGCQVSLADHDVPYAERADSAASGVA